MCTAAGGTRLERRPGPPVDDRAPRTEYRHPLQNAWALGYPATCMCGTIQPALLPIFHRPCMCWFLPVERREDVHRPRAKPNRVGRSPGRWRAASTTSFPEDIAAYKIERDGSAFT
jgi:hypothetical protein